LPAVAPADPAKEVPADPPLIPAGAEAVAPSIPAEALTEANSADLLAAAVATDLPRGAVLFESIAPVTVAGEPSLAVHRLHDLQEQYETERQRADQLARLDRHRTTFFSDVSQECRTPLTLILGPASDLLAGAHGPLTEEQREQIRIVHQNGIQLLKLMNTIFTFVRIEAGANEAMWELPDGDAEPADVSGTPPPAPPKQPDRAEGRILIAEDDAGIRAYLSRLLGRRWTTVLVSDGQAAFDAAIADRPDLIITDVVMPGLDGLGLLRALRADARTSTIPVLVLSARGAEDSRIEGLAAGATDYLVKPFSGRELEAKVHSQIELSKARRRSEEHVASRDAFYAAAAHELRNPIHSLRLQIFTMLRSLSGEEQTPKLEWMQARVEKAYDLLSGVARLLDRLLDMSRISSGRLPLVLEDVDLAAVAAEVIARLEPAEQAQLICTLHSTTGHWDRVRLEQILTNLLTNALKYGEGQPIEILVQDTGPEARLTITDHGIGIAAEHHARIFERFERAVTDRQYSGFGLGLWITSRIVEEFGGTMSVQSHPGDGSTFVVELPKTPPVAGGS
jgi:signal transduction histidine kinase